MKTILFLGCFFITVMYLLPIGDQIFNNSRLTNLLNHWMFETHVGSIFVIVGMGAFVICTIAWLLPNRPKRQ